LLTATLYPVNICSLLRFRFASVDGFLGHVAGVGSMDGLRLAAAIRDRWPPIHLILVTGLNPPQGSELPRGSQFLRKPYGPHDILSAVDRFQ